MDSFTESTVEQAALAWLESVGWSVRHGAEIAPGELAAERSDYGQVVLEQRLRDALAQLNPGLPAAAVDENATIWTAFQQLQIYKAEVPSLFVTNSLLVISDGVEARVGTLTAGREWFKPWRTVTGERLADPHLSELQVVSEGVFAPRRFLDLVRDFIVFEDEGGGRLAKKMAGYHQFHAVRVAVSETLRAAALRREADRVAETRGGYETGRRPGGKPGDRRIGVVWHTQGSGQEHDDGLLRRTHH